MRTKGKRKARKPARSPKTILVPRDVVPPFPATVHDKLISATSIIKATTAAMDNAVGDALLENFDPHWTLSVAVAMLEQAQEQLEREQMSRRKGGVQ